MTLSEILGATGTIVGIVIGASSKYIGGLLNKKRDDTLRDFEINRLKEKVDHLEKVFEDMDKEVGMIAVLENRIKNLERDR